MNPTPVDVLFMPVLPWVNSSTSLGLIFSSLNWRCYGFVGGIVIVDVLYASGAANLVQKSKELHCLVPNLVLFVSHGFCL